MLLSQGQLVSAFADETDKYRFIREETIKRNDKKVLEKLDYFGEPDGNTYEKYEAKARNSVLLTVFRYTGYFSKSSDTSIGEYLLSYLKLYSKCYGINLTKFLSGTVKSLATLNTETDSSDAITPITELKVPVLLISGEEDMVCTTPTAKRWSLNLNAPRKEFIEIKNASHMVNFEKPQGWNRLLINLLADNS